MQGRLRRRQQARCAPDRPSSSPQTPTAYGGVSAHSLTLGDMSLTDAAQRERARPLPPDDRREAILWAVLPLLKEHGSTVSTRQLAEAAGVAEGTLFRAFGDKETLIRAAIEKFFDPLPLMAALRALDRALPLQELLAQILAHLRARFAGIFQMMGALGLSERPAIDPGVTDLWLGTLRDVLAPHADELTEPVETVAYYLRLLAFASSFEQFNVRHEFGADELARLVRRGVACGEALS